MQVCLVHLWCQVVLGQCNLCTTAPRGEEGKSTCQAGISWGVPWCEEATCHHSLHLGV